LHISQLITKCKGAYENKTDALKFKLNKVPSLVLPRKKGLMDEVPKHKNMRIAFLQDQKYVFNDVYGMSIRVHTGPYEANKK